MKEFAGVSGSDGDVAVLAELVAGAERIEAQLTAVQVAQVRLLARAGRLAATQAAGASGDVREHDMALRSIAAELGGVVRVTDRTMQQRIDEAVEHYPAALAAWEAGRITRGHVRVIVDAGLVVPAALRARFVDEAVDRCERDTPKPRAGRDRDPCRADGGADVHRASSRSQRATRCLRGPGAGRHVAGHRGGADGDRRRHPRPAHAAGPRHSGRPGRSERGR